MTLAYAGPERAAALAALHAQAFDASWSEEAIAGLMHSLGVLAFEAPGGFVMVRVLAEEAEILTLGVAPEARRQGVGRTLVRAAASAAAASGAEALFLEVAADNSAAVALYEGEGFARAGLRRGYYARPGAQPQDALVLRLALNRAEP